jgi:hypothetical protein
MAENPLFGGLRDRWLKTTGNNSREEGVGGQGEGVLKQVLSIFGVFVQGRGPDESM